MDLVNPVRTVLPAFKMIEFGVRITGVHSTAPLKNLHTFINSVESTPSLTPTRDAREIWLSLMFRVPNRILKLRPTLLRSWNRLFWESNPVPTRSHWIPLRWIPQKNLNLSGSWHLTPTSESTLGIRSRIRDKTSSWESAEHGAEV